ncbi:inositol monophosphatase family protein [Ruegeria aquimaris]|uniref:ADP-ribosylglycohydrolase family protein n=1 Tax=Ruegeria aquimaris TaxID=2984333 RepID=A0ABT3ARU7_9RHOB|nr:inositol monophosphatase family protein [Ruegeria sp. XHP0148]MCV2891410.1 ADP-ribosylglycohydrolase family protein [Ruegeria sp. XHP0148]
MRHDKINPANLLPAVIASAETGCSLLLQEFHRPGGPRLKHGKSVIDHEVEIMLRTRLLTLHPCAWHGEETCHDPIDRGDVWVVDPLDGTSDFQAGHRGSALSIALLRDGRPVLGVVASPVAPDDRGDIIAWAEGASLTSNGKPCGARANRARPVIGFSLDAGDFAEHTARVLSGMRILASPSPARRLSLVAAGDLDAAVSLTRGLQSWDIAGGHALLIGAGLVLTDLQGRPVVHHGQSFHGCLAGNAALVAELAAAQLVGPRGSRRPPTRPRVPVSDPLVLERAQGCLLGQLTGDALGSAVEFQDRAAIARSHPQGVRDLVDGGTWNLIAGQPTDDSEMALARSILREAGYDAAAVAKAYIGWKRSDPFDIGFTTSSGIAALERGLRSTSDSQSNGALMRVSPIGIFAQGDPLRAAEIARQDAALTHPSMVCQASNAAFAAAVAVGIAGGSPRDMMAAAERAAGSDSAADLVRERLSVARQAMPGDFQSHMGWVLTALQNAFYWLGHGAPLEEAVIATVAQGGDTDTNAAICGALLGAAQGRAAIPARWRDAILTCRAAPGTRRPRPCDYWPDDAMALAETLVAAGMDLNRENASTTLRGLKPS